jgi:TetR/AcrR family transcriptional regulator, transcriptional repressor for nem operon
MGVKKKGESTKQRIVRSATKLIYNNGYKNTSIDDILTDSDTTKGSFYYHFKNKDEVARAAVGKFYSYMKRTMLEPMNDSEKGSLDAISIMFDLITANMERQECVGGCLLGNMALEISDCREEMRVDLAEIFKDFGERLKEIIVRGQGLGEIRVDRDAGEMANFVIAVMEGGLLLSKVMKEITPLKDSKDQAMLFLHPVVEVH